MKIDTLKLVYFSATGTTKTIIEAVARGIGHGTAETIDITKSSARKQHVQASANELLVIGVPVYVGRVPALVINWLRTLKASATPAVCIVVYGNREYGDALLELKATLAEQGCHFIAGAAFIGEHSFSSSETPIASGRPDISDIKQAELFGKRIREKLQSMASIDDLSDIAVPGSYPYEKFEPWVLDFIAVNDNCSLCGVCTEVCPVNAVSLENSVLIDKEKCILCCACIKGCPENALTTKPGPVKNIALQLSRSCKRRREPELFL